MYGDGVGRGNTNTFAAAGGMVLENIHDE